MRLALRLAVAAALLASCGLVDSDPQSSQRKSFPGTVTAGLPQIGPIDPPRAATASALTLLRTACDQLTGTDPETGEPRPALAARWSVGRSAKKISITLRRGIKFQDGSAVTSEAVREALSRVARPPTASAWASLVSPIAGFGEVQSQAATNLSGIKILSPLKLEIELVEPYSGFPTVLGHPALTPVSLKSLGAEPAGPARPVCAGPYRVQAGDQAGRLLLTRTGVAANRAYSNRGAGYSSRLSIIEFEGPNDAYEAFKAGAVDLAPIPENRAAEAQGEKGYHRSAGLDVTLLAFDTSKPVSMDPRLRQAISLAIDRLVIIDAAFGDQRQPAVRWLGETVSTGQPSLCPSFARKIADPGKAKELLAATGIDPATISMPLIYDERSIGRLVAQAISIQVKDALGVQFVLEPMDGEAFEESLKTKTKAAGWILNTAANLPVPDELLGSLFHTGSPANRLGYSSPEIDAAIDRARGAAGADQAANLWALAEDAVCAQMPSIPMWRAVHHWIVNADKVTVEGPGLIDLSGDPVLRHLHGG